MIKKFSSLVLVVVALLMVSSMAFAQGEDVIVTPDAPVRIGVASGLSGEGIAPLGIDIQRGVELAQTDRPTVVVGGVEFAVELDPQDELCSAIGGQTVANLFTADETIAGVVGHMCSSSCLAAAPIYDTAGFTTISPSCTSPLLTVRGFTSFNRTVPSDGFQGVVAAEFIFNDLGITKIATLHDGSPYGEGLVTVMSQAYLELGGEIVGADAITVGETNYRSTLENLAAGAPELIYFGGFTAEAARLVQQMPDAGLEGALFLGADGMLSPEFVNLAGEFSEGVYASAATTPATDAMAEFLTTYVEVYGEEPPAPFHANAYDAYNVLLDGIEAVGVLDGDGNLVINRAALQAYVRSVTDFEGLTGALNSDGTGEFFTAEQAIVTFQQVQSGEFVEVKVVGGAAEEVEAPTMSIAEVAMMNPDFSVLVEAVLLSPAVLEALTAEGATYTVFAPTNAAFDVVFEALGITSVAEIDAEMLTTILMYHAVEGETLAAALVEAGSGTIVSLSGEEISYEVVDGVVVLNGGEATVVMADVLSTNGVIHVIDGVLFPPSLGE
ncbi:MAG TPA: ABC transporter substrate-binding protein [Aggregatilineales bacterium]|nr:ABC transporter substrate-binding protein [Aggregatilineales bacterium]